MFSASRMERRRQAGSGWSAGSPPRIGGRTGLGLSAHLQCASKGENDPSLSIHLFCPGMASSIGSECELGPITRTGRFDQDAEFVEVGTGSGTGDLSHPAQFHFAGSELTSRCCSHLLSSTFRTGFPTCGFRTRKLTGSGWLPTRIVSALPSFRKTAYSGSVSADVGKLCEIC
jgi:hypothetical protein